MADIYFYKSITGQVYNFRDDRVDNISGILPATAAPLMDGTAAIGTSIKYAREDHVHPADTNKVDKEAGKGLSTNDFTTAEKDKLAGIAAGAEVNVQSDWDVSDSSSDAFIKNKPTVPSLTSQLTNDSGFITKPSVPYFTCATAAATAAKVATLVSGTFTEADLVAGAQIAVKFTNANTVASPTLKAGDTTAKTIRRYGTTSPSTSAASSWNAGSVIYFVYDGTDWQMVGWLNTTYSGMTDAEYQAGTSTTNRLITPARLKAAILYYATYTPATEAPLNVAATAAVGTSAKYAREDHVHAIVDASATVRGVVNTTDQVINGAKTFARNLSIYGVGGIQGLLLFKAGSTLNPTTNEATIAKIYYSTGASSAGMVGLTFEEFYYEGYGVVSANSFKYVLPRIPYEPTNSTHTIATTYTGRELLTGYGECNTAAGTAAKTLQSGVVGVQTLRAGITLHIRFANSNTATNPTLEINSLGAKPIYRYGTTVAGTTAATSWQAGAVVTMTYNGTGWIIN